MKTNKVNLIRVKRLALGINMAELARRLGVSRQLVSYWEAGDAWPGDAQVPKLARAFNQKPEAFARELEESRLAVA